MHTVLITPRRHRPRPRLYWLDCPSEESERVEMHRLLAHSTVRHVAVQAHDGYLEYGGNIIRANTLSHIRAIRRIQQDQKGEDIAYVAENTLSYAYTQFWTTTLERILCNAPEDWGIIQLAYYCGPVSEQLARYANRRSPSVLNDPFCVEKSVIESAHAPFVPWTSVYTEGTTFYAIHPRGYTDILKHVRRYKYDPLYEKHKIPRFDPNVIASHLFALTTTYTFHLPMFTFRPQTRQLRDYTPSQKRLNVLVKIWFSKYVRWKEHVPKYNIL